MAVLTRCVWLTCHSSSLWPTSLFQSARGFSCISLGFLYLSWLWYWQNKLTAPSDWLERLVSEMTYYVSSGTLNSTNSTQLHGPWSSSILFLWNHPMSERCSCHNVCIVLHSVLTDDIQVVCLILNAWYNNTTLDNVYGAVIRTLMYELTWFIWWCRTAPSGCWPSDQANWLELQVVTNLLRL